MKIDIMLMGTYYFCFPPLKKKVVKDIAALKNAPSKKLVSLTSLLMDNISKYMIVVLINR